MKNVIIPDQKENIIYQIDYKVVIVMAGAS